MKTVSEFESYLERVDTLASLVELIREFNSFFRPTRESGQTLPWDIADEFQHNNVLEIMRAEGFAIALANGLDGTWEATFHEPKKANDPDYQPDSYAPGDTMAIAIFRSALKALYMNNDEKRN